MNYRSEMNLFGGNQGKAFGKIVTCLVSENRYGTGTGSVRFSNPFLKNMPHEVVILLHLFPYSYKNIF